MAPAMCGDGRGHFVRGFMHCCRSGKTLLALKALWGYDGELRPHQARALERFPEVLAGPRRKCMVVFSTLPVLQQFLASTLKTATEEGLVPGAGSVVMVCSASDDIQSEWCRKVEDQNKVERILQTDERVLFVTTYASAYKIDLALRATESSLDLAVFDEAHSVHTAKRYFLWGGGEGDKEEDDAGGDDASRKNIEAETSSDAEGADDAGMEGGDHTRNNLRCTEASVLALEQRYPRRLYLTATPSKRMQRDDALVRRVYGTPDGDWDVFKFSDLLKAQREYAEPCVKEFDVLILVNGKPKDCKESAEFYDKVCVLREIAEAGVQNNKMSRVLMYHALASARSGARSAENYGNKREWQLALTHVKRKGKGRYAKLNFKDFEFYAVRGEDADVQEKLAKFNSLADDGKIHILCSCRVFGEGVTLERCDMTVFADGKRSPKDIVQSGLRGVKFDEAKPEARLKILLLTNLDGEAFHEKTNPVEISEEIAEALRARDKMEPLALVLAALKEEDDEFSEEVMAMLPRSPRQRGTKDGGSGGQGSDGQDAESIDEDPERGHSTGETQTESVSVASDGDFITETQRASAAEKKDEASRPSTGRGVGTKRFSIRLSPDLFFWKPGDETVSSILDEFVSSMTIELCSLNTSAKWEQKFQELIAYRQEHGNCNVPQRCKRNTALGHWVNDMRQIHKAGKLASDRKERLESIGFVWDPFDSAWEQKFQELFAYRQEHGDCNVIRGYKPNPSLATWVNKLRQIHKAGKLASDRKERLESIGFVWVPLDSAWEQMFQELLAYRQEHGNCNVPQNYSPNPILGVWVSTMRQIHKAGKLSSDRKERLESIGFVWDPLDSYWEQKYEELFAYRQEHGNCNVPQNYSPNPILGVWVITLRQIHKADKLASDRKARLDSIGFVWDPLDSSWEQKYQELTAYRQEHSNCNVPDRYAPNPALSVWINTLRRIHKAGKLASDRKARLDSIGFVWDPLDSSWEQMFQELLAYRREHSNCNVPARYTQNPALGGWVSKLRHIHNAGKLASDRKARLDSIGFVWDLHNSAWGQMFQELLAYRQEHGDCNVPQVYEPTPSLGGWVGKLRRTHKAGKLASDRKERLESIGFVWDLRKKGAARDSSKECVLSEDPELAESLSTKRRVPGVDGAVHAPPRKKPRLKGTAATRTNHDKRRHRADSASPPSLEDASQVFRNACANAEAEAEQPAKKLRMTTKTYDASSFSIAHVNFKNNVLSMLLAGCPEREGLRAAFLDDFAEDGVTLRTTQKLLETGRFAPQDLYCANPNHKVVEALRSIGVNAAPGVFVEAAREWKRDDSNRRFDLAYVDLCTGSADEVQKNLEAVLPSMAETSVLAYTITGRSGSDKVPEGEHDHTWHMMGPRMQRILRSVEKDPYNFELVGTLPGRKLGDVKQASEIFFSDGARGARVCTVLFKRGPGS